MKTQNALVDGREGTGDRARVEVVVAVVLVRLVAVRVPRDHDVDVEQAAQHRQRLQDLAVFLFFLWGILKSKHSFLANLDITPRHNLVPVTHADAELSDRYHFCVRQFIALQVLRF